MVDKAIVLRFKSPRSYTGEDMVQLHCHGGPAVVRALSKELDSLGLRRARPGEFTRRAVNNCKIDVLQAEQIMHLTQAETDRQLTLALESDASRQKIEGCRRRLTELAACLQAFIDFPEDTLEYHPQLASLKGTMKELANEFQVLSATREKLRTMEAGFTIALVGRPNAGKSSLINAIARSEVSIVSPVEGTTRDVVSVRVELGGYPCTILDTAGLRPDTCDQIEAEGVSRALKAFEKADLCLLLLEPSSSAIPLQYESILTHPKTIPLISKIDLVAEGEKTELKLRMRVSSLTGQGLKALTDQIVSKLQEIGSKASSSSTNLTGLVLRQSAEHLERSLQLLQQGAWDLSAYELRKSLDALGEVAGRVDIEEVLDELF